MDYSNGKETPAAKEPLGHDFAGAKFGENWEYPSVLGMLLHLSSK